MELRRQARLHQAGVTPEDYHDFAPGQKVWVVEGFLGTVTAVEDGPFGDEQYLVELDDGMGGGTWNADELLPADASLSVEAKVASEDYPELSDILTERPPLPHSELVGISSSMLVESSYVVVDDAGQVVAGPFLSRQDAAEAEALFREDGDTDLMIQRTSAKEAGFADFVFKMLAPAAERMIEAQPEHIRYDPQTGAMASYDWCRFRQRRRCFYPRDLDAAQTAQKGFAVYTPIDRGFCTREKWEDQKACPAPSEPGPESREPGAFVEIEYQWNGAAVTYEQGMNQRVTRWSSKPVPVQIKLSSNRTPHTAALIDGEFTFHFTAGWRDIQEKAKRIRGDGHVRVISSSPAYLVGEVRGDTNIYQTSLMRETGTNRVAMWECGCAWAAYSWGRSGRWKKYEGRMCSHALALHYEGQSRGWAGGEITEDRSMPVWRRDPTIVVQVPGDYKRPEGGEWRVSSLGDDDFDADTAHSISLDASLHEAPIRAIVADMAADGDDPAEIASMLAAFGVGNAAEVTASITREAGRLRDVFVKVRGQVKKLLDIIGDKGVTEDGEEVDVREMEHPNWHPSRGLSGGTARASKTGALEKGTYGNPKGGNRSVIVGFSEKAKGGEITDEMTPRSKYVVFVEQSGGYRMGRIRIESWEKTASLKATAEADSEDGAMIAIRPPDSILSELDADEDYDNLHVTVVYLGKSKDVDTDMLELAVAEWAEKWGPIPGQLSGYGVFENGEERVLYASVDAPGLDRARDDLIDMLASVGEVPVDEHGFDPHMTLGYGNMEAPKVMSDDAKAEFEFGSVFVVYGPEWIEYPLKGGGEFSRHAKTPSESIADFERQENQTDPFDGVALKEDDDGWYVSTHRARSDSYASADDIPDGDIEFIRSTGVHKMASLLLRIEGLRSLMAMEAQEEYDEWDQDTEGGYGICDEIAARASTILRQHLGDVDILDGGHEGDDHAWLIVVDHDTETAVGVDIAPSHYERGGGYSWTKIPGVTFTPRMVDVFEADYSLMKNNRDFDEFYTYGKRTELAELKDEPEAALPETTGEDEADIADFAGDETDVADDPEIGAPAAIVDEDPSEAGEEIEPGDPRLAWLMKDTPQDDNLDIANAARAHLAAKEFSAAEQQALINEGADVQAANLDRLQLEGTHYQLMEDEYASDQEEEDLWFM